MKVGPDESLRGRCLLQLSDYGHNVPALRFESAPKTSWHVLFRLALQFAEVEVPAGLCDAPARSHDNLVKNRSHKESPDYKGRLSRNRLWTGFSDILRG